MNEKTRLFVVILIYIAVALAITLLVFYALKFYINYLSESKDSDSDLSLTENTVIEVIDGDTFILASREKVRLICIDAPEINSDAGLESKNFLEKLILGKEVRLEKDISDKDQYDRLLRYVYVDSNGEEIFVNKELVKRSYASAFPYGNDTKRCNEIQE